MYIKSQKAGESKLVLKDVNGRVFGFDVRKASHWVEADDGAVSIIFGHACVTVNGDDKQKFLEAWELCEL